MEICRVIGNVWATKKAPALEGLKLMIVQNLHGTEDQNVCKVAADMVGAGIGERVLVVRGSSARLAASNPQTYIDAAIVGIVDEMEIPNEGRGGN